MPLMTWSPEYSVGIPSIDAQHKKLMDILNELADGMAAQKSKEIMSDILKNLIAYTVEHFSYEENLFAKTNYPETEKHKLEHAKLKEKATELLQRFEASKSGVISIETSKFLKDWLVQHIQGSDKKYSDHLIKAGIA